MARTFERRVTELHVQVTLLNEFTQLACPTTVPVGPWHNFVWGMGNGVQTGIYATEPFYKLRQSNALH